MVILIGEDLHRDVDSGADADSVTGVATVKHRFSEQRHCFVGVAEAGEQSGRERTGDEPLDNKEVFVRCPLASRFCARSVVRSGAPAVSSVMPVPNAPATVPLARSRSGLSFAV